MHMRIDREVRTVEREEQDARGGLRPDAGERYEQIPQRPRTHGRKRSLVECEAAPAKRPKDPADANGLRRSETTTVYRPRDRQQRRVRHVAHRREASAQIGIRALA